VRKGTEGVARRYARALVDVAAARGEGDGLRAELDRLSALYAESSELRLVLRHPAIPTEKKTAVVAALSPGGKPSEVLARLIALLVERDRVELLPFVAAAYVRLWNAQRGVVEAEAVSARALDETEAQAVAAAAGRAMHKQVELRRRVDPSLMGGLLLRMEGRVYDGSMRARLRALRARLAGAER
jgi:F-type H+-transporting ATPase subunit delta